MRLKRVLCTASLKTQAQMTHATFLGKTFSDHNPLDLTMMWGMISTLIPKWRLQPSLLENAVLKEEIAGVITNFFTDNTDTASSPLVEWEAFKVVIRGAVMVTASGAQVVISRELKEVEDRLGPLEKEAVLQPTLAQQLEEARVEHAELLERL
ncbi:hypothetical protein NDU88_007966 [Pleurodeles waltl]|uniref:Uncharacterized protein n=1 Tax=Pleurodeles waltl TaxID=8319 RepID=A0AAV7RUB7_PLEWA|nr:hypothetical protein NDU88_007966 [Pleurodeles waltl]